MVRNAIASSHTLAIIAVTTSAVGSGRVKPSVYLSPTAQPISQRPATARIAHAMALLRRHPGHGDVEHAVAEAPLVVVPARHLHEAPRDLGEGRVEHRRARIVVEVDRDERRGV